MATTDQVRTSNWAGSIPVVLSLASSSLSTPSTPAPLHVLISRHTFLHMGLQEAVLRLYQYAPSTFSFNSRVVEEPEAVEESSDEEGVSNGGDCEPKTLSAEQTTTKPSMTATNKQTSIVYPKSWFEDENTELPLQWQLFAGVLYDCYTGHEASTDQRHRLPWRIRVHFTNYPSAQLLDLDVSSSGVLTTVERAFKNSLKQSLVLQHNQNKVALNMTKQTHQRIWDSILTSKYATYKPIQHDIQATTDTISILPIRLITSPSKPFIQKRCNDKSLTLGELLVLWQPQHFHKEKDKVIPSRSTTWKIAGLSPPLTVSVVDLWKTLSHPDGFLYICVT